MTRDEYRAKCIEAMDTALYERTGTRMSHGGLAFLFDSLAGLTRVNPMRCTAEMADAGVRHRDTSQDGLAATFEIMSAIGDLTNAPGEKR